MNIKDGESANFGQVFAYKLDRISFALRFSSAENRREKCVSLAVGQKCGKRLIGHKFGPKYVCYRSSADYYHCGGGGSLGAMFIDLLGIRNFFD